MHENVTAVNYVTSVRLWDLLWWLSRHFHEMNQIRFWLLDGFYILSLKI